MLADGNHMNENIEVLSFSNRKDYREWLLRNHDQGFGIWIVFIKGDRQFTANDALEESICFGWIDGLMKRIDEKSYKKYFSKRKDAHKWSEKNIGIFNKMVRAGLMTDEGLKAFKADGVKKPIDKAEMIKALRGALIGDEEILAAFDGKAPSKQKQFAGFYCEARTDETREKRKNKIIEALRSDYRGMLY